MRGTPRWRARLSVRPVTISLSLLAAPPRCPLVGFSTDGAQWMSEDGAPPLSPGTPSGSIHISIGAGSAIALAAAAHSRPPRSGGAVVTLVPVRAGNFFLLCTSLAALRTRTRTDTASSVGEHTHTHTDTNTHFAQLDTGLCSREATLLISASQQRQVL